MLLRFATISNVLVVFIRFCCAAPRDIDLSLLSGPAGFKIVGFDVGSLGGFSVSSAGDVNKDGVDDLIVGAHSTDVSGSDNGVAYVLFGRAVANGVGASYANIDVNGLKTTGAARGFAIIGSVADCLGISVSAAGDVNHDGIDDLIVGAPYADPGGVSDVGFSFVVFGRNVASGASSYSNVATANLVTAGSSLGFSVRGIAANDISGIYVSTAGDVNGDGVDDAIVVSSQASAAGGARATAGVAYVIFGRRYTSGSSAYANIQLSTISSAGSSTGFAIQGGAATDQTGYVSAAGDVNGDGVSDVLIGSIFATVVVGADTRSTTGISYVVFGRRNTTGPAAYTNIDLQLFRSAGSQYGFAIFGAVSNQQTGIVSGPGDVNDDGLADVLIGANGGAYLIFGRSYLTGSASYSNIDLLLANYAGFTLGFIIYGVSSGLPAVGCAGDVNGDGVADIILGERVGDPVVGSTTRTDAGITYVLFGRPLSQGAASANNVDLATFASGSPLGYRILGAAGGDSSGISVKGAGDVNKDGVDDMIIGARYASAPGAQSGAAYVVFGVIESPTSQPSSQPSSHPSAQPSGQPQARPSSQPSGQPSRRPTSQPTRQPSAQPSNQPTARPSRQPLSRPTSQPSGQPTGQPSRLPSGQPTTQPSTQPVGVPTSQPTTRPSSQPSVQPSRHPSGQPTVQPSTLPSSQPSAKPSSQPSVQPSRQPSGQPTVQPSTPALRSTHSAAEPAALQQTIRTALRATSRHAIVTTVVSAL